MGMNVEESSHVITWSSSPASALGKGGGGHWQKSQKHQLGFLVSWLRFKFSTSPVQVRDFTTCTKTQS